MVSRAFPWISSVALLFGGGAAMAAAPPGPPFAGNSPYQSIQLVASTPSSYSSAYQSALSYLEEHVSLQGMVTAGNGQPASADSTAWAAVALAENGQVAIAEAIAQYLVQTENANGGWNQSLDAGEAPTLGASARVLWALSEVAGYGGNASVETLTPAMTTGANALSAFNSPAWGTFSNSDAVVGSAEDNAIAIVALRQVAGLVGGLQAQQWSLMANQADSALLNDSGVSRVSTRDFLAAVAWNLDPNQVAAQRAVGAMPDLGFAYQGYGAKSGPGYYSGMDWTDGVSTFNDVIASVNAGLPDNAEMQYNYGLTLQNADGGFGTSAHPPVGPETGGFASGPNASSVSVTSHYLLATDDLLQAREIGFGWKSAVVSRALGTMTVAAPPVASLDPTIPMQDGIRVAVVVSDPSTTVSTENPATDGTNEANLELNAAWQLTQLGYQVTLFWYKPNHAENYYPLSDLWPSLNTFQAVVVSDNGFQDQNGYKTAFASNASTLTSWLQAGGRLVDLGDNGPIPLPGPLAVQLTPESIDQVSLQGASLDWSDAASAFYSQDAGYQTLITGSSGSAAVPVAVGAQVGQGRIVLTTLNVASHRQDHLPITQFLWNWATQGMPPTMAPNPSYPTLDQTLYAAMQSVYGVLGTDLYRELSNPTVPQNPYSYLYTFTQAMAGVTASASALPRPTLNTALTDDLNGLQAYYDSALTPPGYESYVASLGGGIAYYDDNGWTVLDLLRAYQDTSNPQFLSAAQADIGFLESGWNQTNPPPGGENWNVTAGSGRTQTSTGSFMDGLLRLYLVTKNPDYLTWAETVSTWDRTYMRSLNGIYEDTMSAAGAVSGTPYTYDTGVILQADVLFYRATGNPGYLERAEQLAVASITAFVDPLNGVLVENAGTSNAPFNVIYLRGLYMLWETDHNPSWLVPLERQGELAARYDRLPNGIYGEDWTGLNQPSVAVDLLTQGATLRLFGMLSTLGTFPLGLGSKNLLQ